MRDTQNTTNSSQITKFLSISPTTWQHIGYSLAVLMILIFGSRFIIGSYARAITNSNSSNGDQGAFLQLGLDMREHGILTDGTRNPLYAAVLATFAERDWSYFTQAKMMSITFGLLTIVAVFVLAWRYFNPFTGVVAAYLLSINVEFTVHSALALTESLLVLNFTLAWFAMLWALDNYNLWKRWAIAGILVALAYLAKGSGQLLMFSFVASVFLIYGQSILTYLSTTLSQFRQGNPQTIVPTIQQSFQKSRSFWIFLLAYVVTVSPYWLYNTIYFGSPTFNYAISNQMWMDSWSDWHPDDTSNLPTAWNYIQSHTAAEIFERLWEGIKAERNILVKTLYPTRTLMVDEFLLSPISGLTFGILALLPLIFWRSSLRFIHKQKSAVLLTTIVSFIFFMLFAWYTSIIAATRFVLPIAPLLFVLGSYIISQIGWKLWQQNRWGQVIIVAMVAVVVIMQSQWWIRTIQRPLDVFLSSDLHTHDREFGEDAATPLAWLADGYPGATVAWGPSGHSLPIWAYSDQLDFERYPPNIDNFEALSNNFIERGIDFVVIDDDMVVRHKDLLRDRFPSNGYTIALTEIPPDWALAFAHRTIPCEWCLFRLPDSFPAEQTSNYQLGESIYLTGFDLNKSSFSPGETVHLTLHWHALATIDNNLTVFTQLLGPDWQLHGQQDNQPVNNHWPTSRWQPGNHLTDRYDIPLAQAAPPGEYHILVGMYNSTTGQRITITHNGEPVADNAIVLSTITVN
jgi:hypothetical protein